MTEDTAFKLVKLLIVVMAVQLFMIGFVLWESYQGRVTLVESQQAGCERGKLDRAANATGWRTAEQARLTSLAKSMHISFDEASKLLAQFPKSDDPPDLIAARRYTGIASEQELRSRISCKKVFPKASLLP